MTRKRRRLAFVLAGLAVLSLAAALVLSALSDNLVFFYSPTDLATKDVPQGRPLRVGGLVEAGSFRREPDGRTAHFRITDGANTLSVTYAGALPDLFREGQGVVVEGSLGRDHSLSATNVLAKHDERYMPREVVDALKRSGRWQESGRTAPLTQPAQSDAR